jgi:two-component system response regulator
LKTLSNTGTTNLRTSELRRDESRIYGGYAFMITASESLLSTRIRCLASSNAFTRLRSTQERGSDWQFASAWSIAMGDGFGLNQREKDKAQPSASPSPQESSTLDERSRKLSIVLVEDNSSDIFLVQEALDHHKINADLICHNDGEQMLSYIDNIEAGSVPCPDIVLLDLNLPRYNGKAILGRMRKSVICSDVPVVVVSSSKDRKDIADAKRLGATKYFYKSIDFDEAMSLGTVILELTRRIDTN